MNRFLLLALVGCKKPVVAEGYLVIENIAPPQGAGDVDPEVTVVASFTERLVPESVDEGSVYLSQIVRDDDGNASEVAIAVEVTYEEGSEDDGPWSVLVDPIETLDEIAEYEVVFTTDIEGKKSGALRSEVQSSFTTEGWAPVNEIPLAAAGDDREVAVGDTVELDGDASTDPEGEPIQFTWRLVEVPAGSTAALDDVADAYPTFVVDLEGTYVAGLVVNDGVYDSSEDYVVITATEGTVEDTGGAVDDTGASGDDSG